MKPPGMSLWGCLTLMACDWGGSRRGWHHSSTCLSCLPNDLRQYWTGSEVLGKQQKEGFPCRTWRLQNQTSMSLRKCRTQTVPHYHVLVSGCPFLLQNSLSIRKNCVFSKRSLKSIFCWVSKKNYQLLAASPHESTLADKWCPDPWNLKAGFPSWRFIHSADEEHMREQEGA